MVYTQMLFALTFDKLVFGTTPGLLSDCWIYPYPRICNLCSYT